MRMREYLQCLSSFRLSRPQGSLAFANEKVMTGCESLYAVKLSIFRLGITRGSKVKASHAQIIVTLA